MARSTFAASRLGTRLRQRDCRNAQASPGEIQTLFEYDVQVL
jgi:hypothetical protein